VKKFQQIAFVKRLIVKIWVRLFDWRRTVSLNASILVAGHKTRRSARCFCRPYIIY